MLKITTLGDFDIIVDGKSILDELTSQKRLIRLFKYFLVHNDMKLLPENIIEDLWGNDDFKDPLSMLRTQISRLRKIINLPKPSIEPFFTIKFINEYYIFKLLGEPHIDFIEFEDGFVKDIINLRKDIENDPLKIKELLLLYNGIFLPELDGENWIQPVRNRFSRLYIKGITSYIEYCKEKKKYIDIINICEKAIIIEPYEEIIHMNFMEALANVGQESYAILHYKFFTKKLYNDLRETPSRDIVELYKKIKSIRKTDYENVDLNDVNLRMVEDFDLKRAHYCELHYFKFLYTYKMANKHKNIDENSGIGLIKIKSDYRDLTDEELDEAMKLLVYTLFRNLFIGDVFTKWNKKQVLMLLNNLGEVNIELLADKINKEFDSFKKDKNIKLDINIKMLK